MDVLLALFTFAALIYFVGWEDYIKPLLGLDRPRSVKSSPDRASIRLRSRRSRRSNAANVPANVPRSAPPSRLEEAAPAAPGAVVLSTNELQQLAEAVAARAGGATVEESIFRGFGLKKGGGPGYRRAKELFDLATAPPSSEGGR